MRLSFQIHTTCCMASSKALTDQWNCRMYRIKAGIDLFPLFSVNMKRIQPSRQFWDRRRWKSGLSIVIWDCGRWKSGPCLLGNGHAWMKQYCTTDIWKTGCIHFLNLWFYSLKNNCTYLLILRTGSAYNLLRYNKQYPCEIMMWHNVSYQKC